MRRLAWVVGLAASLAGSLAAGGADATPFQFTLTPATATPRAGNALPSLPMDAFTVTYDVTVLPGTGGINSIGPTTSSTYLAGFLAGVATPYDSTANAFVSFLGSYAPPSLGFATTQNIYSTLSPTMRGIAFYAGQTLAGLPGTFKSSSVYLRVAIDGSGDLLPSSPAITPAGSDDLAFFYGLLANGDSRVTGSWAFEVVTSECFTCEQKGFLVSGTLAAGSVSGGGTGGADVPEPASLVLVGAGLLGLAAARRRRDG